MKFLIVDKDNKAIDAICSAIAEFPDLEITKIQSFELALKNYLHIEAEFIISEWVIDNVNGMEFFEEVWKRDVNKPIVMVYTHINDSISEVAALNSGADDYITKHLSPPLLRRKIEALQRRKKAKNAPLIKIGELLIDEEKYLVRKNEEVHDLQRKEFEIVKLLSSQPGKVFSRTEILNSLWSEHEFPASRTIDVHIRKLRSKLGNDTIQTIKGMGYKLATQANKKLF
jgi:two-component system alkaline phosphatase synthesis response regulator PhoP